jgi:hypothetical protein
VSKTDALMQIGGLLYSVAHSCREGNLVKCAKVREKGQIRVPTAAERSGAKKNLGGLCLEIRVNTPTSCRHSPSWQNPSGLVNTKGPILAPSNPRRRFLLNPGAATSKLQYLILNRGNLVRGERFFAVISCHQLRFRLNAPP